MAIHLGIESAATIHQNRHESADECSRCYRQYLCNSDLVKDGLAGLAPGVLSQIDHQACQLARTIGIDEFWLATKGSLVHLARGGKVACA